MWEGKLIREKRPTKVFFLTNNTYKLLSFKITLEKQKRESAKLSIWKLSHVPILIF